MTDTNNSNLMYGSSNDTSAFIKLAESEIKNGNYERAIELLRYGIKRYPNYPSPYFLYGKVLLTLGKIKEAEDAFQTGFDLIGFDETEEYYKNLIPEIEEEIPTEENLKEEEEFIPRVEEDIKIVDSELEEVVHTANEHEPIDENTEEISNAPVKDEVDLDELADKLSNAKMDTPRDHEAPATPKKESQQEPTYSPGRGLVSETLARIYVSQGNYKEAIEIYETLIEIQPEREDYYEKKLDEIKMKRGNRS